MSDLNEFSSSPIFPHDRTGYIPTLGVFLQKNEDFPLWTKALESEIRYGMEDDPVDLTHLIRSMQRAEGQADFICSMDILVADCGFYLESVSFNTISDAEIAEDYPIDSVKMKQLRMQFRKLTPNQKFKLEYLIQNYGSEF